MMNTEEWRKIAEMENILRDNEIKARNSLGMFQYYKKKCNILNKLPISTHTIGISQLIHPTDGSILEISNDDEKRILAGMLDSLKKVYLSKMEELVRNEKE